MTNFRLSETIKKLEQFKNDLPISNLTSEQVIDIFKHLENTATTFGFKNATGWYDDLIKDDAVIGDMLFIVQWHKQLLNTSHPYKQKELSFKS